MHTTYEYTNRAREFLSWIRALPEQDIVPTLERGHQGGFIRNLYGGEVVSALLRDRDMLEKLVPTGRFSNLLDIPGLIPLSDMDKTWEEIFGEGQKLSSDSRMGAWLLRARCQAQKQELNPRDQIKKGHVLPWILLEMRAGNVSDDMDEAREDILRAWGKGLAACHLSQGSAGSPVKALTLACAGHLAQRWPDEIQNIFSDPQYKTSVSTLLRRARGLQAQAANRNPWDSDKWKYPTPEEMAAGISVLTRQALRQVAKADTQPASRARPAF